MQLKLATACFALAASSLLAQPSAASFATNPASQKPPETIYEVTPDITPPTLLPAPLLPTSTEKCKKKFQRDERIQLSLFVATDGKPQWIAILHALGNNLDQTALDLAHSDRFTPATRNGEPLAVWQSLEIELRNCREDPSDQTPYPEARLTAEPFQSLAALSDAPRTSTIPTLTEAEPSRAYHVGGSVTAPFPLITPNATYSDEARKKKIQGSCLISMIVDAQGMPQNPRIVRPLGSGLDENALQTVRRYRFKPARKGIQPVPVVLTIEVNFRLYLKSAE